MKTKRGLRTAVLTAGMVCFGVAALAACPSGDLTSDCFVDMDDLSVLAGQWLTVYDSDDLSAMVLNWLTGDPNYLVSIHGGTFQMGNSFLGEGYPDELPVHAVTLSPFYMSKYEITNGQYCAYLNSAYSRGLIAVISNVVYKAGSGTSYPYCNTYQLSVDSQINWNGSSFTVRSKSGRDMSNDPMVCVSWYGAVAYCNWRSQQEGKPQCYNLSTWTYDPAIKGYHLPTEAQWEYAARGGLAGKRYPWGDTINQTQANFYSTNYPYDISPVKNQYHPIWNDGAHPYTSPVGYFDGTLKYKTTYNWPSSATSYQTANGGNGYGLYDMAGNVLEWCNDLYSDTYYSSSPSSNPIGPTTGTYRVLRGGFYNYGAGGCRVAYRYSDAPTTCYQYKGFRVCLDILDDILYIPGGTFQMGDSFSEGSPHELPIHAVTLSPFYMSKYEITNAQYCAFLNSALSQGLITITWNVVYQSGSGTSYPYCDTYQSSTYSQINWNGSTFTVRTKSGRDMSNAPMVTVSWYGAVAYCNWQSQQEGKQACYNLSTWVYDPAIKGYHLPTEAQWEYAARGGLSGKRFPWGDTINQTQADFYSYNDPYDISPVKNQFHPLWNDGVDPYTSPVGFFDGTLKYKTTYNWPNSATSYQTENGGNGYGLYDMAGNVSEWCHDWHGSYGSVSQTNNPTGPVSSNHRVLRGGCWGLIASHCRVASRNYSAPTFCSPGYGFRISLDY